MRRTFCQACKSETLAGRTRLFCFCTMEMLKMAKPSHPQPTADTNVSDKESEGYMLGGQGSPAPAETASPRSYCQQSPSLPASGLTEFKGVDSVTWDMTSDKPQELLAVRDSGLDVAGVSQKQYLGVRVKMPVRELLRKMRLSKAIDSSNSTETSGQADIKGPSRRTGRKRAYVEKRPKENRQKTLRSMEELDILVEVLQKDLCESHCNLGSKMSTSYPPGTFPELQLPWWEASGSPQPDGKRVESSCDSRRFQPSDSFPDSGRLLPTDPTNGFGSNCQMTQQHQDRTQTLLSSCVEERLWPGGHVVVPPRRGFGEVKPRCHNPLGRVASEPLERDTTALQDSGEWLKPSAGSFVMSFFQFQLHQEESWLASITVDKLLAPDKNGNRLLHKAVMQGKRALSYALSWRFAQLNRIDEKNGAKQTALHIAVQKNHHLIASDLLSLGANVNAREGLQKTALHLCAEKGYLRVLEVLRSYQERGTHIEVDAIDHQGLTPLQCAACVHSALLRNLENSDLTPEVQKVLILHKEQMLSSINCLLQMGANPWVQGAKSSIQASDYLEKVQKDHELLFFLQTHSPKRQEDSGLPPDPNGIDLPYQQREDLDPALVLLSDFCDSFPDGDFQGSIDPSHEGAM